MNDTSENFCRMWHREIMTRSHEERILMGARMHESSRELVEASLPDTLSIEQRRYSLFLRFYGRDFPPKAREKIRMLLSR